MKNNVKMQTENPEQRTRDSLPPRTLEFRQAMKDFRIMFPTIDRDLIECVLRSNSGHVDSTIDQLLQLSQDQGRHGMRQRHFPHFDDSTDTDDSIPSELLSPPTSSDDDVMVRDPPPMYTPRAGDSFNFLVSNNPIEVPFDGEKKRSQKSQSDLTTKCTGKTYKAWNPPMLGTLPEDFLRILPQQFIDVSAKDKRKKKSSSSRKQTNLDQNSDNRAPKPPFQSQSSYERKSQTSRMSNSMPNSHQHDAARLRPQHMEIERNPGPVPPPRPSRTIDSRSRRIPQPIMREQMPPNSIEQGHLFIRPAFHSNNLPPRNMELQPTSNSRSRYSQRSSRTSHNRTATHPCIHQSSHNSLTNGNLHRRHSDFASRRMVMVPRTTELSTAHHENMNLNGVHPVLPDERDFASYPHPSRSSSYSRNHCQNASVPLNVNRTRKRTQHEEEQYVEDCRLAILLQNEEFISELKRNEEFLKALEKDRNKDTVGTNLSEKSSHHQSSKEFNSGDIVPLPDPDAKYTHGSRGSTTMKQISPEELDKEDEKAFKENLKHMGKSARKKFNEIARKFSVKKKSYKPIPYVDPVFANCDDEIEEIRGRHSPVFELNGR